MYTEGIRKIFDCSNLVGETIGHCAKVAIDGGYRAMLHNGRVYILFGNDITETCFTIKDFETK